MLIPLLILGALGDMEFLSDECGSDELCKEYSKALDVAKTPTESRIYKDLTKIKRGTDKEFIILVAPAKIEDYQYERTEEFVLTEDSWYTAHPDLQQACKGYTAEDKTLRMKQQLGMPPTADVTGVVHLHVAVRDIFRPCPDPETFDIECAAEIMVKNQESAESNPDIPWFCPAEGEEVIQYNENFIEINDDHYAWMCDT